MTSQQTATGGLATTRGASHDEMRPGAVTRSARHRAIPVAGLAVLAAMALAGCASDADTEARIFDAEPRTVAAPAAPTETRPDDLATPPPVGSVQLADGVFTDVLELTTSHLETGRRPVVVAELGNPVDAAPLLQLEVRALFFDRNGNYLGDATLVEEGHGEDDHTDEAHAGDSGHGDEPFDSLPVRLTTEAPLSAAATSATLQVVQFVTE